MAVYFCDTSAVVKRYVSERGTAWLTGVTDRAAGNRVVVAGITGAETIAAITRKQRSGGLLMTDAAAAIAVSGSTMRTTSKSWRSHRDCSHRR